MKTPKTPKRRQKADGDKRVNRGRHQSGCKVCAHRQRAEIEQDWLAWGSTARIAKQYGLTRDSIYRHAHAMNLFMKRERNVRKALERIIEQAESVPVNATAVVSAVQTYARINSAGQFVERSQRINLNDLFERLTNEELEAYAKDGRLPAWFSDFLDATPDDGPQGGNDS